MERNMEFLIECMDDLSMEQQKVCVPFYTKVLFSSDYVWLSW